MLNQANATTTCLFLGLTVLAAGCGSETATESVATETVTTTIVTTASGPSRKIETIQNFRVPSVEFSETLSEPVWAENFDDPLYDAQLICQKLDQGVSPEGIRVQVKTVSSLSEVSEKPMSSEDIEHVASSTVNALCPEHSSAG